MGRINGRFGTLEHAPIHYLDTVLSLCMYTPSLCMFDADRHVAQGISTIDLCALSFIADVALITSLREGMSKVAFEFILCQAHDLLIAI